MGAVTHAPWQVSSPCAWGTRPVPRGPKFGISILCGNGPPFAACHRKIGGFVPARVPPAERGPVCPLCSMTPLISSLSLFLGLSPSSYFISSLLFKPKSMIKKTHEKKKSTAASHLKKGHLVVICCQIDISFRNERTLTGQRTRSSPI